MIASRNVLYVLLNGVFSNTIIPNNREEIRLVFFNSRRNQCLLSIKVVIQGSFSAASGLGDLFIGQASQALRLKHAFCRLQNVLACSHQKNVPPSSVFVVPMWNFAYPYKLKQLIDLACQRNMLFPYDGIEYGPLLKTPRAFVVYARGGTYAKARRRPLPGSTIRKVASISD